MVGVLTCAIRRCQAHEWAKLISNNPRRSISQTARFPATLLHFSRLQRSCLYDIAFIEDRPDDRYADGVTVSGDGKVHFGVNRGLSVSNGAIFYPHTFMMQELIRSSFDEYLDAEEEGRLSKPPMIFTIPKGTPLPSSLVLCNDFNARFSLQPSTPMDLQKLNQILDEFYDAHAQKELVDDWLGRHPFESAVADGQRAVWMAK